MIDGAPAFPKEFAIHNGERQRIVDRVNHLIPTEDGQSDTIGAWREGKLIDAAANLPGFLVYSEPRSGLAGPDNQTVSFSTLSARTRADLHSIAGWAGGNDMDWRFHRKQSSSNPGVRHCRVRLNSPRRRDRDCASDKLFLRADHGDDEICSRTGPVASVHSLVWCR